MSKNIEINYKDDSGYEVLYPATESRQVLNLLTDSTKTYIGLDPSSTPDDAFRSLYLLNVLSDKASFRLTVKTAGGTPIANLPVTCDKYLDGNSNPVAGPLYTDENGVIDTFFANGSVTLSVTGYADLENWSQQYSVVNGEQYEKEVALTTRNFMRWTSSTTTKFSPNVSRVDVSCVGGGGGAGGGVASSKSFSQAASGGGGGGGYVTVQEAVSFSPNTSYQIVIGAGGAGGTSDYAKYEGDGDMTKGGDGGSTTFLTLTANGGKGGNKGSHLGTGNQEVVYGTGGAGNGAGGRGVWCKTTYGSSNQEATGIAGTRGSVQGYSSFTEMTLYGGGGGSGACGEWTSPESAGGTGGSSYGGNGGNNGTSSGGNGKNGGSGFGGGGGSGGFTCKDDSINFGTNGSGGSGCVAIRMHLKAT